MSPSDAFGNVDDGGGPIQTTGSDLAAPQMGQPPPVYIREINRLSNTVISSATIALIRAIINRPKADAVTQTAEKLPGWFADEYKTRATGQAFLRQYGKDTLLLTAAAYVMDWVEEAFKGVRGHSNDAGNKMAGGVAAGSLLGVAWYPRQPTGRAFMAAAGGMVGYLTYSLERASRTVLLAQQQALEKEMLHKDEAELRPDVDPYYLRELVRMKQRQMLIDKQREARKLQPPGSFPAATQQLPGLRDDADGAQPSLGGERAPAAEPKRYGSDVASGAPGGIAGGRPGMAWPQSPPPLPAGNGRDTSSGTIGSGLSSDGELRLDDMPQRGGGGAGFSGGSAGGGWRDDLGRQQRGRGDDPWLVIGDDDGGGQRTQR